MYNIATPMETINEINMAQGAMNINSAKFSGNVKRKGKKVILIAMVAEKMDRK